jgi:hypothetical protein
MDTTKIIEQDEQLNININGMGSAQPPPDPRSVPVCSKLQLTSVHPPQPYTTMLFRPTLRNLRATGVLNRRFIASGASREAYLEPLEDGITCLSLNRPASKNAISVRLLKVRAHI